MRHVWFWLLKNTVNKAAVRAVRAGRGPFSVVRHVGRKSGIGYETPLLLVRHGDDFLAELTYGPGAAWYRNVVAAGGCVVVFRGAEYRVDAVEPCDPAIGMRAFGWPAALVLRLLRRREFRLLRVAEKLS
jgi:deazaflavin-dependent oxidoreductase (nitroreductase family)